jgi:cholesterol oxidase
VTRLASPHSALRSSYDVVVIGSGYGGAIAASRLARAGKRVCLLERGRERQPGEYAWRTLDAAKEMQFHSAQGHLGSRTGLFDFHVGADISALVGCGLGGTSLINAGVLIAPDPRVFDDAAWPEAYRGQAGVLASGMARAEHMLQAAPYPASSPTLAKLAAHEASARGMNAPFNRLKIAVNFEDRVNEAGIFQPACNNCGDCVGGCNVGAKNTLIMNYLPDAKAHGAEIFTELGVRHVERTSRGGWRVVVQSMAHGHHGNGAAEASTGASTSGEIGIEAAMVIVAAGTLGSTEVLLRSRERGLPLSDRLGEGFSGNGDVLGFAFNTDETIDGIGVGPHLEKGTPGPCITGIIDLRGTDRLEDGMIIEEGVVPSSLTPIMAASLTAASATLGVHQKHSVRESLGKLLQDLESFALGAHHGAVHRTQTYLVMAHDNAGGVMSLHSDRLKISWPGVGDQPIFERIDHELRRATAAIGGTYIRDPLWTKGLKDSLITVHPLGGCRMADTSEHGVVNHRGQVFAAAAGGEVHDGLYVADGSIVPRPLGVNPLLTISALAEHICDGLVEG